MFEAMKKKCISCGKDISVVDKSAIFDCFNCGKVEIVRCGQCRKISSDYKCPECRQILPNPAQLSWNFLVAQEWEKFRRRGSFLLKEKPRAKHNTEFSRVQIPFFRTHD